MGAIAQILTHPNPALKLHAAEVDVRADKSLRELVEDMARTMYEAPGGGIGLAATQVGVLKRVVVYDLDEELVCLINPVVTPVGDETEADEEACLSLPGLSVVVERASRVVCDALDLSGRPFRVEGEGLLARLLQHECDHLDGLLIIDRAAPEERKAALQRYREQISL